MLKRNRDVTCRQGPNQPKRVQIRPTECQEGHSRPSLKPDKMKNKPDRAQINPISRPGEPKETRWGGPLTPIKADRLANKAERGVT